MFYDYLTLSSIQVRPATAADAAQILDCLAAAFAPYRDRYTPDAYADTTLDANTLHERLRSTTVFVAVDRGTVAGTIGCQIMASGEADICAEWPCGPSGRAPASRDCSSKRRNRSSHVAVLGV